MTYLSIIVPLHNEAARLPETAQNIIRFGQRFYGAHNYEVLLIENGSEDNTWLHCRTLARTFMPVRAYQINHRSKADAVKYGMMMANGAYRYMCDADLSTPLSAIHDFMKFIKDGWDIVIGSREHRDSQVSTTFKRRLIGRVFQAIVNDVTGLDYRDTQCGFKMFKDRVAEDIFSRVELHSMAFDVEVLYLARQLGYYCTEIPITWMHNPDSRVRLVRDSWAMLKDVLHVPDLHRSEQPLKAPVMPL